MFTKLKTSFPTFIKAQNAWGCKNLNARKTDSITGSGLEKLNLKKERPDL